MINQSMSANDWAMLLLLSLLWGGSFFFISIVVTQLPPLTIVLLRVGIAAVTLWVILIFAGYEIPKSLELWRWFFILGLLNNVIPFTLIVWGQNHIGAGLASIINATTPLFTLFIAGAFLADEHMTPQKVMGVLIGLLGVTILIGPESLLDIGPTMTIDTMAQLAIMGAAMSYGFASVFGRRFKAMGVTPLNTVVGQVTSASIILLPIAVIFEQPHLLTNPSLHIWLSMLCLGMFCTALGYILFFRILASSGANNVVLVTLLVPVSASFLSWLILGEQLHGRYFLGMALIGLGLAAIDGRLWKYFKAAIHP